MKKPVIPQKFFMTKDDFQTFVENEKEWMYNRIYEAIEYAFLTRQTEAYILEARIEETMSIVAMNSEVEEWQKSLSLALDWNISQEKYEVCAKIHKLMEDIKNEHGVKR